MEGDADEQCIGHLALSTSIFEIYVCHVSYINGVCNWVTGDKLIGEVSRIVVAEACIQALDIEFTEGEIYEINSVEVTYNR